MKKVSAEKRQDSAQVKAAKRAGVTDARELEQIESGQITTESLLKRKATEQVKKDLAKKS